jgi:hypothetical protein
MNPFKDVNWNPDLREKRKFALSLIIGIPAIALFFSVVTRLSTHVWKPFFLWLAAIGCGVGVLLWLIPQIARPFYMAWYFAGCCIGIVVGNVIFSAIYFLILTPFGIVRRMSSPAVTKSFDKNASTYWQSAEKQVDLKRYYRQF